MSSEEGDGFERNNAWGDLACMVILPNGSMVLESGTTDWEDGTPMPVNRCYLCQHGRWNQAPGPQAMYRKQSQWPGIGHTVCWEHSDDFQTLQTKAVYVVNKGRKVLVKRRKV